MPILSLPIAAAYALAVVFGTAGITQLSGIPVVRNAYLRMDYSARAYRAIGAVEFLAACFLVAPQLRSLGIVIAAFVNFIAVVLLLKNRKYLLASPGMAVMAALPLALPPVH